MRSALQRKVWHVDFFLLFVFLLGLSLRFLEEWVMYVVGGGGRIVFLGYCLTYFGHKLKKKSDRGLCCVSVDVWVMIGVLIAGVVYLGLCNSTCQNSHACTTHVLLAKNVTTAQWEKKRENRRKANERDQILHLHLNQDCATHLKPIACSD